MAGSYQHCVGEDGKFDFDLIENMGDAHEACEEMFAIIRYLALYIDLADPETQIERAKRMYYDRKG